MKYEIYSGAGNDFVMINNWDNVVPVDKQKEFTARICDEKFKEIDGVIFLDKPLLDGSLVRMNYYNRDGSYGAMCGNGARCTAQFAFSNGIIKTESFQMEAVDKLYKADILGNQKVRINFPDGIKYDLSIAIDTDNDPKLEMIHWIYVGSEHIVVFLDDINAPKVNSLDDVKVQQWGSLLRYHPDFQVIGANVNFVQVIDEGKIRIRTYERGVERETLACGTGIVSSAIVSNLMAAVGPPVTVLVQSGEELKVDFKIDNGFVSGVTLEGSARKISEGKIE
jgi:diaminopimelate epimerase